MTSLMPMLGGFLGTAILVLFISILPISYRVEARSNPEKYGGRRYGYTNIWAVALNIGVARDRETQALRRKLLMRLAIIAGLFVVMSIAVATLPGMVPEPSSGGA